MDAALRKRIITISGTPCSGKSTVNNLLAEKLGYETYSLGSKVKQLALEQGLEAELFYRQNTLEMEGRTQSLDEYLDAYQGQLGEQKEKFILDSRLGFYFVPQSFRVFLYCQVDEAARRSQQARKNERLYESVERAKQTIAERVEDEQRNYTKKYGIPNFHLSFHYDVVLDATVQKPETIAGQILEQYKKYEQVTREIEIACWAQKMVVAKSFPYKSGPITGSRSLYAAMKEHGVRRKEDLPKEVYDRIRRENVERSQKLEQEWIAENEGPVLLPGKLGSDDVWSQRDYVDLSKEIMRLKATEFIFEDGWEYSNGSVEEYLLALRLKKPMFDQRENPLKKEKALELLATAVNEIHQAFLECPKLDFLLEQLKRM